jgi:hypothetical protein
VSRAFASPSGFAVRARPLVAVWLVALTLPVLAVRASSTACADVLGSKVAGWLVAVLPTPVPAPEEWQAEPLDLDLPLGEPPSGAPEVRTVAVDAGRPKKTRAKKLALSGIRISSAQILALAARGAMPSAVFVKGNAQRPAGLLLSGVSALGVGMQDGDILTEAAGQKVSSVAAVVGIVLAARARQASEISGRFYRAGVPFSLTVEQPYPKAPVPG